MRQVHQTRVTNLENLKCLTSNGLLPVNLAGIISFFGNKNKVNFDLLHYSYKEIKFITKMVISKPQQKMYVVKRSKFIVTLFTCVLSILFSFL